MASIHRFRDLVALNLPHGPTLYLTPKEAVTFSRALKACAMDVRRAPFVASAFGTATIPIDPGALQSGREYDQKRKG